MAELTAEDRERVRLEAQKICQEALEETARSEAQMNEAAQRREQARLEEAAQRREKLFPPPESDSPPYPSRGFSIRKLKMRRALGWLLPKVIIVGMVTLFARIVYHYFDSQETWCNETCQPGLALRCESFLFSHDKARVFCITPEGRVTVGIRK